MLLLCKSSKIWNELYIFGITTFAITCRLNLSCCLYCMVHGIKNKYKIANLLYFSHPFPKKWIKVKQYISMDIMQTIWEIYKDRCFICTWHTTRFIKTGVLYAQGTQLLIHLVYLGLSCRENVKSMPAMSRYRFVQWLVLIFISTYNKSVVKIPAMTFLVNTNFFSYYFFKV